MEKIKKIKVSIDESNRRRARTWVESSACGQHVRLFIAYLMTCMTKKRLGLTQPAAAAPLVEDARWWGNFALLMGFLRWRRRSDANTLIYLALVMVLHAFQLRTLYEYSSNTLEI